MSVRHAGVVALAFAAACGGGLPRIKTLSTDWEDDHGASIEHARAVLAGAMPPSGSNVVVAVAGHADGIVGLNLDTGAKWTFTHPLDARPAIAGHVIVLSGDREVVALDAESGTKLWARPTGGLSFLGAGDDGSVTMLSFAQRSGRGSSMLAVLRDGTVVRQTETPAQVGVPAVVHGHAFVPWAGQYVSVIDLANGDEVGRVVLREHVSRALIASGELYFGELGFFRWDDRIGRASRGGASHLAVPTRGFPGAPHLMDPGNEVIPPVASARDSVRVYARPAPGGGDGAVALDDATYYSTYFKIVVGVTEAGAHVKFAHLHDGDDLVGGGAVPGGFIGCDAAGKVFGLASRDGAVVYTHDLGEPIRACVVQADTFRKETPDSPAGSLASQLGRVVRAADLRMTSEQRFLLRELSALPDDVATKFIIEVASDSRAAPELIEDARAALAKRRTGVVHMRAALSQHYDYLHDVLRPPPVGPLSDAVAGANDLAAAPLVAAQLLDPASGVDDVWRAAVALRKIGTLNEVPALAQFFALNRAIPDDNDLAEATIAAGEALVHLEPGDRGRGAVERAVADGMTNPTVRERLAGVLKEIDAAARLPDAGGTAPAAARDGGAPDAARPR